MCELRKNVSVLARLALLPIGIMAWLALVAPAAAQPANDNFADAETITGIWGSVTVDTTAATDEPNEPSHAGYAPANTVWYKFVAPTTGELTIDTYGSDYITLTAVYTGTNVQTLAQLAANDGVYFGGNSMFSYIFAPMSTMGVSGLRFNTTQGEVYYIAVGGYFSGGNLTFNWAYHPSGVFRFASGTYDFETGFPKYVGSEWESQITYVSAALHDQPGIMLTVTRTFGSSGRMMVDYEAEDDTAINGFDYFLQPGTLVFEEYEMSRTILVPIFPSIPEVLVDTNNPGSISNRQFYVNLSNARKDPAESPDVPAPKVDSDLGSAVVTILDMDVGPETIVITDTNGVTTISNPVPVINIEKKVFRASEIQGSISVAVYRTGNNPDAVEMKYLATSLPYWEDNKLNNVFDLQPGSDYATPEPITAGPEGDSADFGIVSGTIQFGAGDGGPHEIVIPINDDNLSEFAEDITLEIWIVPPGGGRVKSGWVTTSTITILPDPNDPPAGSVDIFWNPDLDLTTFPPALAHPGADGVVYDLVAQSDNKTVIAGDFRSYNTYQRNRVARINPDGGIDTTFDPGDGANYFVTKIAQTGDKYLIAGAFNFFNGTQRNGIARLLSNGNLDTAFKPGLGANGVVWAMEVQPDGKILIGGEFTTYNGTNRNHIARLNADGSLDTTFDPGIFAPNGTVNGVTLTSSGKIVVGGEFTALGPIPLNNLARFNSDGTPDTEFNNNLIEGVDGPVYDVATQGSRVVIVGEFGNVGIYEKNRIARLNDDGTVDTTFYTGIGADDTIYTVRPQEDGSMYVCGLFGSFNGTHRSGLARLLANGTVDTGFLDTAYNQFAGFPRRYFDETVTPKAIIWAAGVTGDGSVMVGGAFDFVGGGFKSSLYQPSDEGYFGFYEELSRSAYRARNNVAKLVGGYTPGPGNISLLYNSYSVNQQQGFLFVSLLRENGYLGYSMANFSVQPGTAQSGIDYLYNNINPVYLGGWSILRMMNDGLFGTNTISLDRYGNYWNSPAGYLQMTVLNPGIPGNRFADFKLANPAGVDVFYLGGENIPIGLGLGAESAKVTIIDDNNDPGVLAFSSPAYSVSEGSNIVINVTRTGGSYGSVSVRYGTYNGTAKQGIDYLYATNTLTFLSGQTNKEFTVRTIDNAKVEPVDRTINLILSNPNGTPKAPSISLSNAVISIVDNDYPPGYVNFSAVTYTTNESAPGLTFTATRTGGAKGTLTVKASTVNGTALAGIHYVATTNILQWNNGDSAPITFTVPLLHDGIVGVDKTFTNILTEATVNTTNAPTVLGGAITRSTGYLVEDDSFGTLEFSAPTYRVNEIGGYATITVIRTGGSAESVTVNYATQDGTAVSAGVLPNFQAVSGTLTFAPGEVAKSFNVPIIPDGLLDADPFFFSVMLTNALPSSVLGAQNTSLVYIIDRQQFNYPAGSLDGSFNPQPGFDGEVYAMALQPDGRVLAVGDFTSVNNILRTRLARMQTNGLLDTSFLDHLPGANAAVRTMQLQTDGRILVGGSFTMMDGINRNHLARLMADGNVDTSFNIGAGTDGEVTALAETFVGTNRFVLVGGDFNTVNGKIRPSLARLDNKGALDPLFNPGLSINGAVYSIAVYPTNTIQAGKILICGDFTVINDTPVAGLARLYPNGQLDLGFDPGTGASSPVRALAIQADGKIVIGGSFTNYNGKAFNRLARVNINGSIDNTFNVGVGGNETVETILIQPDNRIVVGGQFTRFSGVTRSGMTRLLPDGTVDPTINFGRGANAFVSALAIQPDGNLLLSGGFTSYDDVPRRGMARIFGGSLAGSGNFEFTSADYVVDENVTNAPIQIRRYGGTAQNIGITFTAQGGTAVPGINYSNLNKVVTFPVGETFLTVNVPVIQDLQITPDLTVDLALTNPQPPAGLGDQPVATLTIRNIDCNMSFSAERYLRNENAIDEAATITVLRAGSTRLTSTVEFLTTTNGTAGINTNYLPVASTLTFLPGDTSATIKVPVLYDPSANGDVTVDMVLTNAVNGLVASPSRATLTVVDVDTAPGQFAFSATNYMVSEAAGILPVTVVRTNGRTGTISVAFQTVPGTALPGVKYVATNGVLTFADGELSKVINIPIISENQVTGDQIFSVRLYNPFGGTILAPATVPVTVLDKDVGIGFGSPSYVALEDAGSVALTLIRQNGTNLVTTVTYATTNITALSGTNYNAASGQITFNKGETIKGFSIGLLDDPRVTGDLSFGVNLSNPSSPAQLMTASTVVTVLDTDPGISFTNTVFGVLKSGTNALVTVARTNANTGLVTVGYATTNGTAIAGVDYMPVSGTLTFSNGVSLQTIKVPIIANRLAQGDREFSIGLQNPGGGAQLIVPSTASIVITDDISGLRFSAPVYSAFENSGRRTIEVQRFNYLDSTVSVNYSTADGTARALTNYVPASGTLTFTNGETLKTFDVQIISDGLVKGDQSVLLNLSNPQGNAVLATPSAATLNIIETDGSLVLPSGSALISESGPANGSIDPGETVTMLLSLRNASGTNTQNLVATLLATNGVTNPSGSQNYGVLQVKGASAFRPFSFTANGTNGQALNLTLRLDDGPNSALSNAVFNFVIGTAVTTFSNSTKIVINDRTNATPYPSKIQVSALPGVVSKATVTLTNFAHTWPADVSVLLVSPEGQSTYLMSKTGGSVTATNLTFTFDDAASSKLPQSGPLVSGTNKPTSYAGATPPFPVPAPPAPYATNLSALNGGNPNGDWSLFVYDDSFGGVGVISNGWLLRLSTATPLSADMGLAMDVAPEGEVVLSSNLTYTISAANYGPSTATNVVVTDTIPVEGQFVSAVPSQGTFSTNGAGVVTWNVGALGTNTSATLSVVVRAVAKGTLRNSISVTSGSLDLNPDNNLVEIDSLVMEPQADLALAMAADPNPLMAGDLLVYTLVVANDGPATAPAVTIANTLPANVNFVAAAPPAYLLNGRTVTFTNLGSLGANSTLEATITVQTTAPGTVTNSASCASSVVDPFKANNSASVKADVYGLSVMRSGNSIVISWPPTSTDYDLYESPDLVHWSLVPNVTGRSATIPIGPGQQYFKLQPR